MRYLHLLTLLLTGGPANAQSPADYELEKARADVAVAVAIANLKDKPAPASTAAIPPLTTYADIYARVGRGERIIALVNLPAADRQGPVAPVPAGWVVVRCDDIPETTPGRWRLYLDGAGQFTMQEITTYAATASGVAVQPRFTERPATRGTAVGIVNTNPRPEPAPGSYGAIYQAGSIYTNANGVVLSGDTNCVSGFR